MQHYVDEWRIGPVIDRITMGLFHHHFGERLADDYKVVGVPEYHMEAAHADEIMEVLRKQPLQDIGNGAFQYQFFKPNEQKDRWTSFWLMRFYEDVPFLSMTTPIKTGGDGRLWPIPKVVPRRLKHGAEEGSSEVEDSIELKWAHMCREAHFNGPSATLIEMVGVITADPGKAVQLPSVQLGLRLHANSGAGADNHILQVVLTDSEDRPIGDPAEIPCPPFASVATGYPLVGGGKLRLDGLKLSGVGAYSFDLAVDGKAIGRVPLTIVAKSGGSVTPKFKMPGPVRLAYAHFLRVVEPIPERTSVTLRDIREFLDIPRGARTINLKGTALLLQIEADAAEQTERLLRAEMLDGKGQRVIPSYRTSVMLKKLPTRDDILVSTVDVPFLTDFHVPADDYQFRFYLDGKPLGEPLDLTVLPPTP